MSAFHPARWIVASRPEFRFSARLTGRSVSPIAGAPAGALSYSGIGICVIETGVELGARRPRFADCEIDRNRCHFLHYGRDETFDTPLRRVIEAEVRTRDLPTFGRNLNDPAAALAPRERRRSEDHVDRAGEIGGDLPVDLLSVTSSAAPNKP